MNTQMQSHLFWGINSPLTSLTGVVLFLTASGRIGFALVCTLALLWVYVFVMTAAKLGGAYFPLWGRNMALLFLSSLAAEIFLILLWILSPRTALECAFFVFLVPLVFMASDLCGRVLEYDLGEVISQAAAEALILGMLILGLALIREPLGFGSISVPGFGIARFVREEPLRFLQASSGALILLGYGTAVYRHYRNRYTNSEED
ncbi:MAG: hypothetical protein LBB72_03030 [Spirochaetaceae bacterium]|jgi:hypothetical protein|nr:hypothetical protein [Spirochaetaceae bacterium]